MACFSYSPAVIRGGDDVPEATRPPKDNLSD